MKKIISFIVLIVCFSFPAYLVFASSAKNEDSVIVNNCSDISIEKCLNRYFTEKYTILKTLEYNSEFESVISDTCDEGEVLDLIVKHRNLQLSDLRYEWYNVKINITSEYLNHEKAEIKLVENSVYKYACSTDSVNTEEIIFHTIQLEKVKGDWCVKNDIYDNDFKEDYEALISKGFSKKNSIKKILDNSKKNAAITKNQQTELKLAQKNVDLDYDEREIVFKNTFLNDTELENENLKSLSITSLSVSSSGAFKRHAYNRTKALNYSDKYVLSPNPNYVNLENYGGNCTNFTSQCLKAGGIVQDKTGNYTWFYTSANNRAPAWASANTFRTYYQNNRGSSTVKGLNAKKCSFSDVRLGDLVQKVVNGKAVH